VGRYRWRGSRRIASLVAVAIACLIAFPSAIEVASADKKKGLEAATEPAPGVPEAIGDYSSGCVLGASALPLEGTGYQVMHPSRRRYYGHPSLVGFLEGLGQSMAGIGSLILIGDMSQPRGGRATGGHASHQSGLDVDIWFWHPPAAKQRVLTEKEREQISAKSVLDGKNGAIKKAWAPSVSALLRFASDDARVERMFVHPIIKRELCASADPDPEKRAWLRKVRPWYGHDDHVHVRLYCPEGSTDCVSQAPVPKGDGCDELDWWFDEKAQADREQAQSRYRAKVVRRPTLPERCLALIP